MVHPVAFNTSQIKVRYRHASGVVSPWYDASPIYDSGETGIMHDANDRLRTWSHAVPAGLEGPYKIDLLVSDGPVPAHREGVSQGVWTGIIDTSAPV